jgi:hypothetical protein
MRMVLKDHSAYYKGSKSNSSGGTDHMLTKSLNEAVVFALILINGELTTVPDLPKGSWTMVPVRVITEEVQE